MTDVLIVGGGSIGCCAAISLLEMNPGISVTIVEADLTHSRAETTRSTGGVRQLFWCPENIQLSTYTLDVIESWEQYVGADSPYSHALNWQNNGYLFLAPLGREHLFEQYQERLRNEHVRIEWLNAAELAARYPCVRTSDVAGGIFSPRDGWHDPKSFMSGIFDKAKVSGARIIEDSVVDFSTAGHRVVEAHLASGHKIAADVVINAAGCWAANVASLVGMPLPVEPMRRFEHRVPIIGDVPTLPLIKAMNDLAVRTYARGLQVGRVDWSESAGFNRDIDSGFFSRRVLPAIVERFPELRFESSESTWTGLYDRNTLDKNMIIGNWAGHLDNFYVLAGFSGHGSMHAPGVGRAISELVSYGDFRTIDLRRFGYDRVEKNEPYREKGIV